MGANLRAEQKLPARLHFQGENSQLVLLELLRGGVVAHEIFEDGQNVAAIVDDSLEQRAQLRFAFALAVPLRQNCRRNLDVPPQFVRRVPAKKQAIKERGFTLRELKFLQGVVERAWQSRHGRKCSLQIFVRASRVRCVRGNLKGNWPASVLVLVRSASA